MYDYAIESKYPIYFRKEEANDLGSHIKSRHSVEIIGIKRVGISNFLRFFLNHKGINEKYINDDKHHLFISIDLNHLIESELFPFWRLTFKRIVDAVEADKSINGLKKKISNEFVNSIQTGDLFMTFEGVRNALSLLAQSEIYPTLFFLRFDRIQKAVTKEFFNMPSPA